MKWNGNGRKVELDWLVVVVVAASLLWLWFVYKIFFESI